MIVENQQEIVDDIHRINEYDQIQMKVHDNLHHFQFVV